MPAPEDLRGVPVVGPVRPTTGLPFRLPGSVGGCNGESGDPLKTCGWEGPPKTNFWEWPELGVNRMKDGTKGAFKLLCNAPADVGISATDLPCDTTVCSAPEDTDDSVSTAAALCGGPSAAAPVTLLCASAFTNIAPGARGRAWATGHGEG